MGELSVANDGKIPKHASAHVSLVQQGDKANEKRIVAERSLHDLGQKPIAFTLTLRRDLIEQNGHYGLDAQILDAEGQIRWAVPLPIEINPLKPPRSVTLVLQARGIKASDVFKRYRCGDGFQFVAKTNARQAILRLGKRRVALDAPSSATRLPKRYIDGHGNRFKLTKASASLKLDGHPHDYCLRVPKTRPPSSSGSR